MKAKVFHFILVNTALKRVKINGLCLSKRPPSSHGVNGLSENNKMYKTVAEIQEWSDCDKSLCWLGQWLQKKPSEIRPTGDTHLNGIKKY